MKSLFIPVILLLSFTPGVCQQTKILTAEKHNEYGIVYSLPSTAFKIEIVTVKEYYKAGHFSKYSKLFTADQNVISKDETKCYIESVKVTPFGIPDPEKSYLMQLKAGALTYIGVAEDGMLLSINTPPQVDEPEELTIETIEGIPVKGNEYLQYVDEDFLSAISDYKRSQILAEELMEIRDAKISLTRGTAETMPTDGRQLEIMLASLDDQEKALTQAFTGSTWKERNLSTFTFIPEGEGRQILCNLSEDGLSENKKGEPVIIELKINEEASLPVDAKGEEKKIPKDAVMYCIPGSASLSIQCKGKIYYENVYQMSQFGMPFGLNPAIFTDKKEPSYAIFDPVTGALKELGTVKP